MKIHKVCNCPNCFSEHTELIKRGDNLIFFCYTCDYIKREKLDKLNGVE